MALQNTGEITVGVNRAVAFEFARNPQQMAECIPGCHDLQQLSEDRYSAVLTSQVAFVTLSFKVIRIHYALDDLLVFPEDTRLPEHSIHQGGFSMVNMSDDCYIA